MIDLAVWFNVCEFLLDLADIDFITVFIIHILGVIKQVLVHIKNCLVFNAKEFGKMTFKSTEVERLGQSVWDVAGDLTMNGVTKPVIAVVRFTGTGEVMGRRAGFEAEFDIKRSDFGHTYGIEKGTLGDTTRIIVGLEAIKGKDS